MTTQTSNLGVGAGRDTAGADKRHHIPSVCQCFPGGHRLGLPGHSLTCPCMACVNLNPCVDSSFAGNCGSVWRFTNHTQTLVPSRLVSKLFVEGPHRVDTFFDVVNVNTQGVTRVKRIVHESVRTVFVVLEGNLCQKIQTRFFWQFVVEFL